MDRAPAQQRHQQAATMDRGLPGGGLKMGSAPACLRASTHRQISGAAAGVPPTAARSSASSSDPACATAMEMAERSRGTTSCSRRHSSCGDMRIPWVGGGNEAAPSQQGRGLQRPRGVVSCYPKETAGESRRGNIKSTVCELQRQAFRDLESVISEDRHLDTWMLSSVKGNYLPSFLSRSALSAPMPFASRARRDSTPPRASMDCSYKTDSLR